MATSRSRPAKRHKTRGRRRRRRRARHLPSTRRSRGGAKIGKVSTARQQRLALSAGPRRAADEQQQLARMKTTVKQLPEQRRKLREVAYAEENGHASDVVLRDHLLHDKESQPDPHGIATVMIDAAGFGDKDVPVERRAALCKAACTYAAWLSYGREDALKNYLGLRHNQSLEASMAWKKCNDPRYVGQDIDDWLSTAGSEGRTWSRTSAGHFVNRMEEEEREDPWDDPDWE